MPWRWRHGTNGTSRMFQNIAKKTLKIRDILFRKSNVTMIIVLRQNCTAQVLDYHERGNIPGIMVRMVQTSSNGPI